MLLIFKQISFYYIELTLSYLFDNNKNVKEDNDMDNIRIPIHIG